ncbi:MAG: type II toxin-antitoxin system PemK/MazF family toxin [Lachnospiraceae bacterium]|nr:type II toxin-antitoxin system PemK/MazF family toxin [Lachnospiraceae bacterium]
MKKTYYRGELYYADLGTGVGSEQNGYRPVVVIQNDVGNKYSTTTIVAAISTKMKSKANLPTHFYVSHECGLVQPSIIMLEQIRTIDKARLDKYIGRLSPTEILGLNQALAISIGLIPTTPKKLLLCLCSTCAEKFNNSGVYSIRKLHSSEIEEPLCAYCDSNNGHPYEITTRKKQLSK